MWLLECEGELQGRRLWLRPGKTYLFGRTAAEPGQLAISHNTISRKHLTITLDPVQANHALNLNTRSKVTIEDLKTKIGTTVNGSKIKGAAHVVKEESVEILMGKCPSVFRLSWNPVVFTFSFTKKELQTNPLHMLQSRFEQLDIKLLTEYNTKWTTHVISKKRNTAKGLQALINAKHIVTETFLDAIVEATSPPDDELEPSALEVDHAQYWPDAMQHLPPAGGEPIQHPDGTYAPDSARRDIFEGYSFIFYDDTQYSNLLAPITNGGGKAVLEIVEPEVTQVEDFVRRVKEVGSFEEGSQGKGVVLVRFLPSKGSYIEWYTHFITDVSLRLDHRPIEQSEFLEAILIKDASILRKHLEVESAPNTQKPRVTRTRAAPAPAQVDEVAEPSQVEESHPAPPPTRSRTRRPVKRRFAGFADDDDIDMDDEPSVQAAKPSRQDPEEGLFVSQEQESASIESNQSQLSGTKRAAASVGEDDLMDGMAPAAARFKRQRLEMGSNFASPAPEPAPQAAETQSKKKVRKEIDIMAVAAQHREQEDIRARQEKEDLAQLPEDVDLSEIRRLNIVEEMPLRQPSGGRTREQDIADGRWDPKWNGVKNFKKFRQRGETTGRQPARVIVPLQEAKNKEFGVGDDYWLETGESQRRKKTQESQQNSVPTPMSTEAPLSRATRVVISDDSEEEEDEELESAPPLAKNAKKKPTAQSQPRTQSSKQTTQSQGKRLATEPPKEQQAPKRARPTRRGREVQDSDDSDDDEFKFRFGKRR